MYIQNKINQLDHSHKLMRISLEIKFFRKQTIHCNYVRSHFPVNIKCRFITKLVSHTELLFPSLIATYAHALYHTFFDTR